MSERWVKDWRRRLRPYLNAPFEEVYIILQGRPCCRKTPSMSLPPEEVQRIMR